MKKGMHRLQFDASPYAMKEYTFWKKITGLPTMMAFVREALCFYCWCLKQVIVGNPICSFDQKTGKYIFCTTPEFYKLQKEAKKLEKEA